MSDLAGLKVAVIATDGVEESELNEPIRALKQAGASVQILSVKTGTIQAFKHLDKASQVNVDGLLEAGSADDFDALVMPGGALNADHLRAEPAVQSFVRSCERVSKPIAFICHAPWILVSSGVVKGRTLTGYHTIMEDIVNAGGEWVDRDVVRDGNWVSSRQPADLPAFNREMLQLFGEWRNAQTQKRDIPIPSMTTSGAAGLEAGVPPPQ